MANNTSDHSHALPGPDDILRVELKNGLTVLARENYAFRLLEVESEVKSHTHPRAHTILITEGAGELAMDGAPQAVRAGDMIHVPGGVVHSLRKTGAKPLIYVDVAAPPLGPQDTTWVQR